MLCNKLNTADSTATLIAKTHRQKIVSASKTNRSIDDNSHQPKSSDNTKKSSALINRGGGDCAANDILKREFRKIKLDNNEALMVLLCEKNSHGFETRFISMMPHTQYTIGRISPKCRPSESNAYFDCKVLSRNQAIVWYDGERKFWIKDTQSSNGTYLNGSKLNDEAAQLHSGDLIQFGLNVYENKSSEVHSCIVASVQLYLPKAIAKEDPNTDIGDRPENLGQQKMDEESSDLCETSRTQVNKSDACDKSEKPPTSSCITEAARGACINFKEEQSDKPIKIELHNIQYYIEALGNSKSDVVDLITKEDSYLQRIYILQCKIRILKRGISADELRTEKQQWENERHLYKRTAKDAIRRVGLECKEIAQKIDEALSKCKSFESECETLRDQIDAKDQSINDFSCLLRHIEIDYDEYKNEIKAKRAKLNTEFEKRIDEAMQQIQKLEIERENLRQTIEDMRESEIENENEENDFDIETSIEENVERKDEVDEDDQVGCEIENPELEQFPQILKKLQQLEEIFNDSKKQAHILNSKAKIYSKFEETYLELLVQLKELRSMSLLDIEFLKSELGSLTTSKAMNMREISAQTIDSDVSDYNDDEEENVVDDLQAKLEELQAQLTEQELNTEQMCDMLENECDMCRQKLMALELENETLMSAHQKPKEQKSIKFTDVVMSAVSTEENTENDYDDLLEDLKAKFALDVTKNKARLSETKQQLMACKERLQQSQAEQLQLQRRYNEVAEIMQKQQQKQHANLLPIMVPIFLGLLGMSVYLIGVFSNF